MTEATKYQRILCIPKLCRELEGLSSRREHLPHGVDVLFGSLGAVLGSDPIQHPTQEPVTALPTISGSLIS